MIKPLPGMNRRDVDQWFNRGIVVYEPPGGERQLCHYEATDDAGVAHVTLLTGEVGRAVQTAYTNLRGWWPLCGAVNTTHNVAAHVSRITSKQYRRTFNSGCIHVKVPREWEARVYLGVRPKSTGANLFGAPAVAIGFWRENYPDFTEACQRIDRGDAFSVAINRRIIVAGDSSGKRMFYFDGELAATAEDGRLYPVADPTVLARINKLTGGVYRDSQNY